MSQVSRRRQDAAALAAICGVALSYVWGLLWWHAPFGGGVPSPDIYGAQFPMLLYAWRSFVQGEGLLWNGLQNCGQPFLPATPPGMLYPLNLLFLACGLVAGFPAIGGLHLLIGGAGVYALCREYGGGYVAALCGAFAFELSGSVIQLVTWLPSANLGAYVWLPVAMVALERLLKRPATGPAVALGVVLAMQLLAGCPQIALFTDQLIGLRILWAFGSGQLPSPGRLLAFLTLAVVLSFGLAAVQMLPSIEFTHDSLRSLRLSPNEIQPGGELDWAGARMLLFPTYWVRNIAPVSLALAASALVLAACANVVLFYWLVMILYVLLMFAHPLRSFYLALPFGSTFRLPSRFLWVVSFALSVLAGLGAEAVAGAQRERVAGRFWPVAALALGGVAFCLFSTRGPSPYEWGLFATLVAAAVCAVAVHQRESVARAMVAICVLASLYLSAVAPFLGFMKNDTELMRHAAAFEAVRGMMTPQDRMFQYSAAVSFSVMPKSASLFDVPSITDYEPQTSRRYAELWVHLVFNTQLGSVNDFINASDRPLTNRPLMNLLATRFVLSGPDAPRVESWLRPPYQLRWAGDGVRIFENPDALPRAYYVPRLEVVEDGRAIVQRLAAPDHRPREVALVERVPADGFLGLDAHPEGTGQVSLTGHGETVRIESMATRPGFVVLTDQYYPGWQATVNGVPAPILRANYVFRAVRVPAGPAVVEFRYRPTSVWLGVAITLLSLLSIVVYAGLGVARRRRDWSFAPCLRSDSGSALGAA